jgi:hypothetical protein
MQPQIGTTLRFSILVLIFWCADRAYCIQWCERVCVQGASTSYVLGAGTSYVLGAGTSYVQGASTSYVSASPTSAYGNHISFRRDPSLPSLPIAHCGCRAAHLSCQNAGKAQKFALVRGSYGESWQTGESHGRKTSIKGISCASNSFEAIAIRAYCHCVSLRQG